MKKFINAKIYGYDEASEILVDDGKFIEFGENLRDCENTIDLKGCLVIPPYVDSHLHLDYYMIGKTDKEENSSSTLFEAIDIWNDFKKGTSKDQMKERIYGAVKECLSHGTQYIRAQTDCTDPNLTGIKAALEVKEELKDKVTIQVVAFPQNGMYSYKEGGKTGRNLVEEALKLVCEVVGGIPHNELSRELGEKSIKEIVDLSLKYDKLIDVHCDETDDEMARFVEVLNAEVTINDIGEKTTASHTCSFGSVNDAYAFRMMGLFRKSKINFICLPTENAYLQGRQDSYPKRRGLTRVREFVDNDINVAFAQDFIVDLWYPAGNGNLMNILDKGIHMAQLMKKEDFKKDLDLVTYNGARAMNIGNYGLKKGNFANFIILDAPNEFEAIRNRAECLGSVRNGEFLFKKEKREYEINLDI